MVTATESPPVTAPGPSILARSTAPPDEAKAVAEQGKRVVRTLDRHGAETTIQNTVAGPTVVRYDLSLGPRTKVAQVRSLVRDVAAAVGTDVRLIEHLDGRAGMGVELANPRRRPVMLGDVLGTDGGHNPLDVAIGLDVEGKPLILDLAETPHLLIGGTTGSGKSTLLHSIITSLLVRETPQDVRFVMIDPKRVELTRYKGFPHMLCPPIKDVEQAIGALELLQDTVDGRYADLERLGVDNIRGAAEKGIHWPYIVIVVDELADLMMVGGKALERLICRMAQRSRAVGIHLVLATQRPSVDVVTGLIKANVPSRIALRVASWVDSKVILDMTGAQALLGKGDLLMTTAESGLPVRGQSPFVTADDMAAVRGWWERAAGMTAAA